MEPEWRLYLDNGKPYAYRFATQDAALAAARELIRDCESAFVTVINGNFAYRVDKLQTRA